MENPDYKSQTIHRLRIGSRSTWFTFRIAGMDENCYVNLPSRYPRPLSETWIRGSCFPVSTKHYFSKHAILFWNYCSSCFRCSFEVQWDSSDARLRCSGAIHWLFLTVPMLVWGAVAQFRCSFEVHWSDLFTIFDVWDTFEIRLRFRSEFDLRWRCAAVLETPFWQFRCLFEVQWDT